MADEIGPVQLLVFGFESPHFGGGIAAELRRLKVLNVVRVLDALVIHKDKEGEIRIVEVTDIKASEFAAATTLRRLIGLDGALPDSPESEIDSINMEEAWDVLDGIPRDSAAALVLLEHSWAIPLRQEIRAEGGRAMGDLWIHPRDLIAVGLV